MADNEEFNQQWKEALEDSKVKRWGENLESKPEECSDERESWCDLSAMVGLL